LILFLKGPDIAYLRSSPELLKNLETEFGQVVWLIEAQATGKKFIENLFFPSKVINMNFFWLPDGKKLTRVLIDKRDPRIVAKATRIHDIAKNLRNVDLIVEYQT
jgi:transcription antitermination factor NusA-like protein